MKIGLGLGLSGSGVPVVFAAPTVSAITPNSGSTAGGDAITDLHGTGFMAGATVTFDGVPATSVAYVSSVKLTCVSPAGSVGTADIVVTNFDTQTSGTSGIALFTYAAPWAPTDASTGMLAWFRSDLGLTQASNLVSAWLNQSGSADANRNLSASGGERPTYAASDANYGGKPVVIGDASQILRSAGAWSASPTPPLSVVIVGECTPALGVSRGYISDPTSVDILWRDVDGYLSIYSTAGGGHHSAVSCSFPTAIMYTDDGTGGAAAAKLYVGNLTTPGYTTTTVWSAADQLDVMGGGAGVNGLEGRIAEVMVFNGVLTPTDVGHLITYLNVTRAYGLSIV